MSSRRLRSALADERGIALPLALIVLTLLTSLTLAFLAMSSTEPLIAANLKGGEQALALAEGGIERAIWALSNPTASGLTNLNQIPAAYNNQQLFTLSGISTGAYAITISSGAAPNTITANGYVVRNGAAVPAQPAQLAQSNIAARRIVQLQITSSGPLGGAGAPGMLNTPGGLPGALTVAGSVQMGGNSLADGTHSAAGTSNGCSNTAGVTIRQKTKLADGTSVTNSISVNQPDRTVGTPPQQTIAGDQFNSDFNKYLLTDAQLAGLKALAQSQGTYVKPTSHSQFQLNVNSGLVFVDTVDGQALGNPPDASRLADVKISGVNTGGWLIVMGSITIDGNVSLGGVNYHGFVYALNDITYKGTGQGGVFGGMVSANIIDSIATTVDTDAGGNANIYYDCAAVANGGGTLSASVQSALNGATVTVNPGTWREVSN